MKRPAQTKSRRDSLTAAVQRLTIPQDRRFRIEATVDSLDVVCGGIFADADSPNKRAAGSARAADALAKLEPIASDLAHLLAELPLEAVEALNATIDAETVRRLASARVVVPPLFDEYTLPNVQLFQEKLSRLAVCAGAAKSTLAQTTPGPRGRSRHQRALMVARVAHWHFEALTGRIPTRQTKLQAVNANLKGAVPSGAFHGFLKDVFNALGIEASAEALAKKVIMEKKGPKPSH